mgnify:CR=1 FL=1
MQVVTSLADPAANIIFGAVVDDRYTGEIHVTIIATGFSQTFQKVLIDPKSSEKHDLEEAKSNDGNRRRPPSTPVRPFQSVAKKGLF